MDPTNDGLAATSLVGLAALIMVESNPTAEQTSLWQRVAGLKLRLVAHANIHRHTYRGQNWFVLHDRASTRHYRFSEAVYAFVKQMDGSLTVDEIWQALQIEFSGGAPAQHEIVQLLAQLQDAELLLGDMPVDGAELYARRKNQQALKSRQRWLRPLSMRFPLADPDRLLTSLLPIIRLFFRKPVFFAWSLIVLLAAVLAASHSSELIVHWSARALDPQNILLMFLVYPFIKALHELGHAAATKVWGGEVHEVGIMLLVFMPVPFVDASSASAFADKWQRIVVGASGIMVEVFLAALGLLVWLNVGPGLVSDISFNVMFVGSVSTLLFNGNPLLRFDAYYVLMDAIEIPNLGQRSNRYLGYLVKRYLFGVRNEVSPVTARGERGWFVVYGIAAFFYRLFISFAIALYVAGKFFLIGIVLAIWALIGQVVLPLLKSMDFLLRGTSLAGKRPRAIIISVLASSVLAGFVFLMPVPSWTQAEGIVKLPQQATVRAAADGFVVQVLARDGQRVHIGDPLFQLDDPLMPAQLSVLKWELKQLEVRQTNEFMRDRTEVGILQDEMTRLQAEIADLKQKMMQQVIHSQVDGIFVVSQSKDVPGRFVKKGELLGHVADLASLVVRVVVPQKAVAQVRNQTNSVEVRFNHQPGESISGEVLQEVPLIGNQLPSRALGTQAGGAIEVDARDGGGVQALEQVYQLDIAMPAFQSNGYVGSKVHVRFNHSVEPLASQWFRSLRQLFLSRFEV